MIITVETEPPLSPEAATFMAIANVLGGMREMDVGNFPQTARWHQAASHVTKAGKLKPRLLDDETRKLLRIAWQTELGARLPEEMGNEMALRVAAQILPVQTYYAVFSAARALSHIARVPCDSHTKVHNDYRTQRLNRAYGTWGVSLSGNAEEPWKCILKPAITVPTKLNPVEGFHSSEDYVYAGLRMSRRWQFEKSRDDWLLQNRKPNGEKYTRLPKGQPKRLRTKIPPTTTMDFLYGLRVRTNYKGIEEYAADARGQSVHQFYDGLVHVMDFGLLHYETMIAQIVGTKVWTNTVDEWCADVGHVGSWSSTAIARRRDAIAAA